MKPFPDEASLPKSQDGSEAIRGGSIGLNRILNMLVDRSRTDRKPMFNAIMINGATFFRNVWSIQSYPQITDLEKAFSLDLELFLEYYNTYLSHVWNHQLWQNKYCFVLVYFPSYDHLPKELRRSFAPKAQIEWDMYKIFRNRHRHETGLMKTLEHIKCFFTSVGPNDYPHHDLKRRFQEVTHRRDSLYVSGDPVGLLTHIPLDLYLSNKVRNLHLLESNTGRIRPSSEFNIKLDKEARVPFYPSVHIITGDDKLVTSLVSHKLRREVLAIAQQEKWTIRSEAEVVKRISQITTIPVNTLRRYDFA